jgi:oligopeptide transport system substrate-binding protein
MSRNFPLLSGGYPFMFSPVMIPSRLIFAGLPLVFALVSCQREKQAEKAIDEGILIVGNSAEPKSLDLQLVTGVTESKIISALFEGLATDHVKDDGESPPGAAESWTHNEASTDWTFRLRRDGRWSDGKPVTAHDFVFAYHRLLHPELAAYYADMLFVIENAEDYNRNRRSKILLSNGAVPGATWDDFKDLATDPDKSVTDMATAKWDELENDDARARFVRANGLDALAPAALDWILAAPATRYPWPATATEDQTRALLTALRARHGEDLWDIANVGVIAEDDHTLRVKLRESVPYLPSLSCHYTWFPVPRHVVLKHGKITDRYTPWSRHPHLVGNGPFRLKTWRFHDVIEVERNPYYWDVANVRLNGIRFHPIENPYTESRAFLAGQVHTTFALPPDLLGTMRKKYPESLRQEPYMGTTFIRFNTTRKGLDDVRVRKALALAIDRDSIVKYISEGHTRAESISPPMGTYRPDPMLSFNPEKARALLAEAGFPNGAGFPRYSMLISRPAARASAEAIQAMWNEHLNISITIENRDWGSYITAQQKLDFDMASAGWIGDYLDPTTFLNMWLKGGGNNNTGWDSPEFEALLRQAAQKGDPAERYAVLRQAEHMFMENMPIAPVSYYSRNYLHHPAVRGWYPKLLDNHPWKDIYFER